jgi:hypothetical protein
MNTKGWEGAETADSINGVVLSTHTSMEVLKKCGAML